MNLIQSSPPAHARNSSSVKSAAVTERVTFESGRDKIVGTFYRPAHLAPEEKLTVIVVTGAWMTVKEQMPANYAAALAARGLAALTFDFRGWGESGGARRQLEDPATKIADLRAAFAYLATRPDVAAWRLGGLGICASAGYLVHAAVDDPTIRSVALVAPWLHNRALVEQLYGGAAKVEELLAGGEAAEAAFRRDGRQTFVPAASAADKKAVMVGVPYYTEPARGQIKAWRNEADPAFWRGWLTFDAHTAAPRLTQPFLMIESDAAALPQGAREFFAAVKAPKQELWLPDISQFDFYDRPEVVARACDAVATHFQQTLPRSQEQTEKAAAARQQIERAIARLARAADSRDWAGVRAIFADAVDFDYTSVAGGKPTRLAADALVAGWKDGLTRYAQTKHNFSDVTVRIDGDRATATFTGQATHMKAEGARWSCGGDYTYTFVRAGDGWRATAARFDLRWEQGER